MKTRPDTFVFPRPHKAITLIELLIALVLLSLIVLGIDSINYFSSSHIATSSRRMMLQNQVAYCLNHMSKYVSQGIGDFSNPPLWAVGTNGFRVRIDPNRTPSVLTDDLFYSYTLTGNALTFSCSQASGSSPACPASEVLSNLHIIPGVALNQTMPDNPPDATIKGMYINFSNSFSAVEVGLIVREEPSLSVRLSNPQVQMKMLLTTHSASTH
jgi:Tfp pilus assembly protein PilV